ncbi:glycine zipper 2TM domain-containing protein [Aquabacterium sp. A08]|uniref:glycine zipper 2TM domain-containing protein n=1 Tax=Aquabacterium sp. A08 TaxID=2718532 RepID=UPI00141F637C|nr:glycine zipper 2TM domain-containing protein [Aquabacterium sp. A08]NIC41569.1 glycine zipper 2TM domain-containing protein [Aquabacterium sp. A08]
MALLPTLRALLLSAATALAGTAAWAQTAPVIRTFTVQQVPALTPGTELVFQLNGTAAGSASVTLDGSASVIALSETRAGQYEGSYTLSLRDQVKFNSPVRAALRVAGLETQAALGQTLLTASAHQAALAAAAPAPVIDYFGTQASGYTGGHDIALRVQGTPGAKVALTLAGSDARINLAETQPGDYRAQYTVRSRDRLSERSLATATLTSGSKTVQLQKALSAAPLQPTLAARQSCASCGVVQAVNVVEVKGEPGYVGAIAGGVAGAVLGNQIGKGDGRTAARILGAVGGAYAGREIEKNVAKDKRYEVTVRLHDGTVQTVQHTEDPGLKTGQPVKIVDGRAVAND